MLESVYLESVYLLVMDTFNSIPNSYGAEIRGLEVIVHS
jgi:hypothetical protein